MPERDPLNPRVDLRPGLVTILPPSRRRRPMSAILLLAWACSVLAAALGACIGLGVF